MVSQNPSHLLGASAAGRRTGNQTLFWADLPGQWKEKGNGRGNSGDQRRRRYQLSAWAKDEAGNRSETTEPLNLWIDFGAPEISIWGADQIKNGFCRRKQTVCIWINDKNITPSSMKIQTSGKRLLGWKPMGNGYYTAVVFQKQENITWRRKPGIKEETRQRKNDLCAGWSETGNLHPGNRKSQNLSKEYKTGNLDSGWESVSIQNRNTVRRWKITDRILSRDGHYTITAAAEDKAGNRTEVKKCLRSIKRESWFHFSLRKLTEKLLIRKNFSRLFW